MRVRRLRRKATVTLEARAVCGCVCDVCVNIDGWRLETRKDGGGGDGNQPTSKTVGLRYMTCESLGVHAIAFILHGQRANGLGCELWQDARQDTREAGDSNRLIFGVCVRVCVVNGQDDTGF